MHQITELWNKLKSMLHHGPSLQPLWQAVVDKIAEHDASIEAIKAGPKAEIQELLDELLEDAGKAMEAHFVQLTAHFEARIAALEEKLTLMSTPSEPAPLPETPAPTEQAIQPDAESAANDSSTAGDNAASPSAQPEPAAAGQNKEDGHDLSGEGSGDHHGE